MSANPTVLVAGATGALGQRLVKALIDRGADVRVIVRKNTDESRLTKLQSYGAKIVRADWHESDILIEACRGAQCVVSALAGLRPVIIDAQKSLLDAAIKAEVPRFIPSDFSMDYQKIPEGQNRNLDLRREFRKHLDQSSIAGTSILNGCFADMLKGDAPFILFKIHRVLCWQSEKQLLDFTTMDDTAAFTAAAALDASSPSYLRIAGEQVSALDLARIMSTISGQKYSVLKPGGLGLLQIMINVTRALTPDRGELYPPWQGMQYFYGMYSGEGKLDPIDNERYPGIVWTKLAAVLAT